MAENTTQQERRREERRRMERRLQASDTPAWLRLLIENATEYAMFATDCDGMIQSWNPGAEHIFGYTEKEILGLSIALLFPPEDRAEGIHEEEMQTALAEGRALDERWHLRKDGSHFFASGFVSPLRDEDGTVHGFAKIARDLTQRKEAEEALERANEQLRIAQQQLEERVQERTAELQAAFEQLAVANAELIEGRERDEAANEVRCVLLRRLVTAQEEERVRLARELHDEMGQYLTALSLGLSNLKTGLSPDAGEAVDKLVALSQKISDQLHHVATSLVPTALQDLGLCAALRGHVGEWSEWNSIPVDLECAGLASASLPVEIETTVYRIVQESLTNVMRHATGATTVAVTVHLLPGSLIVLVEDNGVGFDVEAAMSLPAGERRLGLAGMQERARLIGGTLFIEAAPGEGTTIVLRLPVAL